MARPTLSNQNLRRTPRCRMVTCCDREMLLLGPGMSEAEESEVDRLGSSAGECEGLGMSMEEGSDRFASLVVDLARLASELVTTPRVGPGRLRDARHDAPDFRIDRGRGIVIEVDHEVRMTKQKLPSSGLEDSTTFSPWEKRQERGKMLLEAVEMSFAT